MTIPTSLGVVHITGFEINLAVAAFLVFIVSGFLRYLDRIRRDSVPLATPREEDEDK